MSTVSVHSKSGSLVRRVMWWTQALVQNVVNFVRRVRCTPFWDHVVYNAPSGQQYRWFSHRWWLKNIQVLNRWFPSYWCRSSAAPGSKLSSRLSKSYSLSWCRQLKFSNCLQSQTGLHTWYANWGHEVTPWSRSGHPQKNSVAELAACTWPLYHWHGCPGLLFKQICTW